MGISETFMLCFIIVLLFNAFYVLSNPSIAVNITISFISGLVGSAVGVALASGLNIVGTGLNDISTQILFGIGTILNLLFRINVVGLEIGLGLITNLYSAFDGSPFVVIFIVSIFSTITLVTGLLTIIGSG